MNMPTQTTRTSPRSADRRAILIFAVLACLTLAAIFSTVWLRMISLEREQTRSQQAALQTEYLAESGLARANSRLAADADYGGEIWEPRPESLGTTTPAKVTIEVTTDESARQRKIVVTAELVAAGPGKIVRRKKQTVEITSPPAPAEQPDTQSAPPEPVTPAESTPEPQPSEEPSP